MMLPRLEYIKQLRTRLGISQRKLATHAGISASMMNQIETGRCKPSYETAKKIFEFLNSLEGKSSMKAADICSRTLISVQKNESIHAAISKMRSHSISQLPVFDDGIVVGILSEDRLAKTIAESNNKNLSDMSIASVMEPPPPIVDISTPAKALIPLVRFSKCVLVSETGNVIGVITLTDTLKMVE
jgi:predicted transcriptional regulator